MAWETIIGLEVHAQLKTKSKLFSGAATRFGELPNSNTSYIDAGLPGVLPVVNEHAIFMAIQFGLAINGEINSNSYFERKNYFYPDLPKGYQISQNQRPIIANGYLPIPTANELEKNIIIARAHLEEDAGKSLHTGSDYTEIDLNRAGIPLLEIVTTPCIFSSQEAVTYLKTLQQLLRFLAISDANMEEGSFRCDVNISLKRADSEVLGTRCELKNLNSFRFIEKAILYEQKRQQSLLEHGESILQETRSYCPVTDTTQTLRAKENENDYRYFPDPDLLPIPISEDEIAKIKLTMPPLPREIQQVLRKNSELQESDIHFLLTSPSCFQFFNKLRQIGTLNDKLIINWLQGPYAAALNEAKLSFENSPVPPETLAVLLDQLAKKTISNQLARKIFTQLWQGEGPVEALIAQENSVQLSDIEELTQIVRKVLAEHPDQVAAFRAGKDKLLAFFVGQVMKETKGRANPAQVNQIIIEALGI